MYEIPSNPGDNENEDDIVRTIARPGGYDETALQQKIDDVTIEDMYEESYGERGVGWRLQGDYIVTTVAGERHYLENYDKEE